MAAEDKKAWRTSLADFWHTHNASYVLVSAPEFGLDRECKTHHAPVMKICEWMVLPSHGALNQFVDFTVAVDFAGSSSKAFCSSRVRSGNEAKGTKICGEGTNFDLDLHEAFDDGKEWDDVMRKEKAIVNSFWICFWRGKVQGALSANMLNLSRREYRDYLIKDEDTQVEAQGVQINKRPTDAHDYCVRMIVAISIDGGPVTQVEKKEIPSICVDVVGDLRRRGYEWANSDEEHGVRPNNDDRAFVVWCHFPSVFEMVRSLDGVRNLAFDYDLASPANDDEGNPTTFKFTPDSGREDCKTVFTKKDSDVERVMTMTNYMEK